ncbi:MAG: 4Fe-4S binding protein [Candidatus Diapherotrites archaeon]|nr:4Fe-4S binding protein [Candidatus Diapherotrites archaeon]
MAERPYVDSKKCTGCGTCVQVCPVNVFELQKEKSVVKNPKDCIQCRACEVSCPAKAIVLK